jgi:UDPglucose--hexose-1-phosphate uridylyltransferase
MTAEQIEKVVEAWKEVYAEAQQNPEINYCQIFENKGQAMGCSNPHPHGQVWMTNIIPEEPAIEHECLMEYESKHNKGLLEDYVEKELVYSKDEKSNRIVALNDSFTALVPFWATWPFEVMLVSRRKVNNIRQLSDKESKDFSSILLEVTLRYDNLFGCSFPYSMGLHQAFTDGKDSVEHLHLHFYPPLLRSATVRKFLVGFEMLGMPQRDITPETAAAMLRKVDGKVHYTSKLQ